ncbi:MAG: hypothetical protein M1814_003267 [Vezdaea aestivalis]|nr:MAG: hypothetical protein M1814_003267 [Vezdaea aestivalis]
MVRIKHRYLLCNILYPTSSASSESPYVLSLHSPTSTALTPQLLIRAIRASITSLFGDYGSGLVNGAITLKYFSPQTSTFVLRAPRAHYRLVWAALTMLLELPGEVRSCVVRVVRISGTMKKVQDEVVRQGRGLMGRVLREDSDYGDEQKDGETDDSELARQLDGELEGGVELQAMKEEDTEEEDIGDYDWPNDQAERTEWTKEIKRFKGSPPNWLPRFQRPPPTNSSNWKQKQKTQSPDGVGNTARPLKLAGFLRYCVPMPTGGDPEEALAQQFQQPRADGVSNPGPILSQES